MQLHANVKLTPKTRHLLVDRVQKQSWSVAKAARAAGVSRQTAHKWLNRFREGGTKSLEDRSCRPKSLPRLTPRKLVQRMVRLRWRRKAGWEIAREMGVPVSTVSKHLKREGVGQIWRLEEEQDPPRRYEHSAPGDLLISTRRSWLASKRSGIGSTAIEVADGEVPATKSRSCASTTTLVWPTSRSTLRRMRDTRPSSCEER